MAMLPMTTTTTTTTTKAMTTLMMTMTAAPTLKTIRAMTMMTKTATTTTKTKRKTTMTITTTATTTMTTMVMVDDDQWRSIIVADGWRFSIDSNNDNNEDGMTRQAAIVTCTRLLLLRLVWFKAACPANTCVTIESPGEYHNCYPKVLDIIVVFIIVIVTVVVVFIAGSELQI